MTSPQLPAVMTGVPPSVPPTPPPPSMDDYENYLNNTFRKEGAFYIDTNNNVAINILNIDGQKSIVRIPLNNTGNEYLKNFDTETCENMVRIARNIGLGQQAQKSGKVVSVVKFEMDRRSKKVKTQKIFTDDSEGKQKTSDYFERKAQRSSSEKKEKYKTAALQLNDLGPKFLKFQKAQEALHAQPQAPQPTPSTRPPIPKPKTPAANPTSSSRAPKKMGFIFDPEAFIKKLEQIDPDIEIVAERGVTIRDLFSALCADDKSDKIKLSKDSTQSMSVNEILKLACSKESYLRKVEAFSDLFEKIDAQKAK